MDRLRAFEVFAQVVGKGSFTRAADALDTSPANVTRYVNELEAHLGTRLLNRSSRRLSLTESGTALYERCRSILDDVAEAEAVAGASALQPRGRLRINAPVSFGLRHLAPLWPQFMQRHPDMRLEVDLTDRVVDIVEEGYDLAVRVARGGSATYVARKLTTSRNLVVASPAYLKRHGRPARPGDLADHLAVGYTYLATGDDWTLTGPDGRAETVTMRCGFYTNNGDTVRAAALAGQGLAWMSTFLVGDDLRAGRLVEVMPDYKLPSIDVQAVYPSRRHLSAKVRVMVVFLAEAFAGTPPWERDAARKKR